MAYLIGLSCHREAPTASRQKAGPCSINLHKVHDDYIQSLCSLHCDCAVNPQHPTRDCCLLVHFVVTVRVGIGVCAERDPLTRWSLRIVTVQRTTLGCSWMNFFSRVITQAVTVKCEDCCHTEGVPIRHWDSLINPVILKEYHLVQGLLTY